MSPLCCRLVDYNIVCKPAFEYYLSNAKMERSYDENI